jgi:beta-phosphoglucomutase-like phosphatase (HAD superfamily)
MVVSSATATLSAPVIPAPDLWSGAWAAHADSAKLIVIGSALFGLAAAVRKGV